MRLHSLLPPQILLSKDHQRRKKLWTCRAICHALISSCETLLESGFMVTTLLELLNHLSMHYTARPKVHDNNKGTEYSLYCTLFSKSVYGRQNFSICITTLDSRKMTMPSTCLMSASHSCSLYPIDSSSASSPTPSVASSWTTAAG